MKRYLLFAGRGHEAEGGWEDFVCSRDTLADLLQAAADPATYEHCGWSIVLPAWWHVVDASGSGSVVREGDAQDLCRHLDTYTVAPEPLSSGGDAVIASGAFQFPGVYCSDCGARLGNSPPTIDEGPTMRIT